MNLQDVAREAGVSVATVSHVINHSASISAETTDRVQRAILELGYEPRVSAKLNKGERTIGVFTPDISNEFYSCVVQAIFDEAWKNDYAVMVCNMQHHHRAEIRYIRSLIQSGVQGLIFCGGATEDEQHILNASKRVPVVLCDRKLKGQPIDSVGTDNIDIMRQVITKLSKYGYQRIGYISEDLIMSNAYDRHLGYRLGMEENGLPIDKNWVLLMPQLRLNKLENAYQMMLSVLDKRQPLPQVFLCTSDLIAVGVMAALRQRGYSIPRDIGVVGFDNISISAFTNPPLTTIAQDMRQLGCSCFRALLKRMEEPNLTPEEITIHAKLVVRGSVRL